jgi:hypothetical protein
MWIGLFTTGFAKHFFEMSKCDVVKRQIIEASDFFAGDSETKMT